MNKYTPEEITKIVGGRLISNGKNVPVSNILLDSRKISKPGSSAFFAIVGNNSDGHQYLNEVVSKGVKCLVISAESKVAEENDVDQVVVEDTLSALQLLVAFERSKHKIPVIGITGSNGKTIVKEWMSQLLAKEFSILKSPKSYNSQTGVPLSVWPLSSKHNLGIFEAGISEVGEMERLRSVIQPTIGIFTNIGDAHDEGFLNKVHKTREKLNLFTNVDMLIYCKDYPEITEALAQASAHFHGDEEGKKKFRTFTWSRKSASDLQITNIEIEAGKSRISATYYAKEIEIEIPFSDEASIENSITCWAVMLYFEYPQKVIERRISQLGMVAMRMELKAAVNNCTLVNDSYNSDLGSLKIALDFMAQQKQHTSKTVILSDILQSGKEDYTLYHDVKDLMGEYGVNRLIGVGKAISGQANQFNGNVEFETAFFPTTEALISELDLADFQNETILLKGSRPFEFERISHLFEKKAHQTVLEINLNALVNNLNVYRSLVKQDTRIMAMVKAFSYGSGSYEIGNVLQFHNVDYLAVAYPDEGRELRERGIGLPIMVMNAEPASFDVIIRHNLEPEVFNLEMLQQFEKALKLMGGHNRNSRYPIHIKLDTGMHRLGFEGVEIKALGNYLKSSELFEVKSIFSHLAASDSEEHDAFTQQQFTRFNEMGVELANRIGYQPLRHILNSAGVVRFPDQQMDMVRLGIGLYGIDTSGAMNAKLENVSTLRSTISQIKTIGAGETIGYNRQFKAEKKIKIGIVGIGYADGLNRLLGNGAGYLRVKQSNAPIVGDICMDMCMIDISGIRNVEEGEQVVVFGDSPSVVEIAKSINTIPYEILTSISQRVNRLYYYE